MTLHDTYKKLENDCFNPLTVDPNPSLDLNHFSLILRLENTASLPYEAMRCLRQRGHWLPRNHAVGGKVVSQTKAARLRDVAGAVEAAFDEQRLARADH